MFAVRAIAGFEVHKIHTDLIKGDPDNGLVLLALVLAAVVSLVLSLYLELSLNNLYCVDQYVLVAVFDRSP